MGDTGVRVIPIEQTRELRHSVLRPHDTLEQVASQEPDCAFAVGAFDDGQLVATGFVAPDGEAAAHGEADVWRVRGMATAPEARGRGVGARVLEALLAHANSHGARRIWCNARTPALSFYERAGFRVASDEFEIPAIGSHFVMELRPGAESAQPEPA